VTASLDELRVVRAEVAAAGIEKPGLVAATKWDDAKAGEVERLAAAAAPLDVVPVSVLDEESLGRLRSAIWELTGLIRVYLRHVGETDAEPLALEPGATIGDVADAIHHELGASCAGGRVWGPSAKFEGQQVGRGHVVRDGDAVEVLAR
jgi:ribosome-interacting GTPase 1